MLKTFKRFGILTCLKYFKQINIPKRLTKIKQISFGEMDVMHGCNFFFQIMLRDLYDCAKMAHEYAIILSPTNVRLFIFTVCYMYVRIYLCFGVYSDVSNFTIFVSHVKRCIHLLSLVHDVEIEKKRLTQACILCLY